MTYKEIIGQYRAEYKALKKKVELTLETFLQANGYRLHIAEDGKPHLEKTGKPVNNKTGINTLGIPEMLSIIQNTEHHENE